MNEKEISVKQLNNPDLSAQEKDELIDKLVLRALKDITLLAESDKDVIEDKELLKILPLDESKAFAREVLQGELSQSLHEIIQAKTHQPVSGSKTEENQNNHENGKHAPVNQ